MEAIVDIGRPRRSWRRVLGRCSTHIYRSHCTVEWTVGILIGLMYYYTTGRNVKSVSSSWHIGLMQDHCGDFIECFYVFLDKRFLTYTFQLPWYAGSHKKTNAKESIPSLIARLNDFNGLFMFIQLSHLHKKKKFNLVLRHKHYLLRPNILPK